MKVTGFGKQLQLTCLTLSLGHLQYESGQMHGFYKFIKIKIIMALIWKIMCNPDVWHNLKNNHHKLYLLKLFIISIY